VMQGKLDGTNHLTLSSIMRDSSDMRRTPVLVFSSDAHNVTKPPEPKLPKTALVPISYYNKMISCLALKI
jgi:hypothetical protein